MLLTKEIFRDIGLPVPRWVPIKIGRYLSVALDTNGLYGIFYSYSPPTDEKPIIPRFLLCYLITEAEADLAVTKLRLIMG